MRVVYFDHRYGADPQPPFRTGAGGAAVLHGGGLDVVSRIALDANAVHALLHHGVAEALNRLEPGGAPVGSGKQSIFVGAAIESAARIFYEADRMTYGALHEATLPRPEPDGAAYRLAIDNRGYQRSLSRLQFLCTDSARRGQAVWLHL